MKQLSLFILLLVNLTISFAQNNIGIGNNTPHASALLDVSSTTKGLLTPRMTTVQRNAIATPAKGLLVYDTDLNSLYHYNGSAWANFSGGGGAFTLPFDQNTNQQNPAFRISNAGIGAAIVGVTTNEFGIAVSGFANSAYGYGIYGYAAAPDAVAIYGSSENGVGVKAASVSGIGVDARSTNNSAIKASIILGANPQPAIAATHAGSAPAVDGTSQTGYGIRGATSTASSNGAAIYAINNGTAGNGVLGIANFASGNGVQGSSNLGTGVFGYSNSNKGVAGSTISGTALYGNSTTGYGLDVSGKVRIAGGNTNPGNGAILTSDATGNAVWKPRRIAFSAGGIITNYEAVPNGSARRVQFGIGEFYDLTQSYNLLVGAYAPTSSSFVAPVDGIFHFDIGIAMYSPWGLNSEPKPIKGTLTFKRNSGGVVTKIAEAEAILDINDCCQASIAAYISRDVYMKAGDFVFVEIYQFNEQEATYTIGQFPDTYFNGHIVVAL